MLDFVHVLHERPVDFRTSRRFPESARALWRSGPAMTVLSFCEGFISRGVDMKTLIDIQDNLMDELLKEANTRVKWILTVSS